MEGQIDEETSMIKEEEVLEIPVVEDVRFHGSRFGPQIWKAKMFFG